MAITYFGSAPNPADNGSLSSATVAVTPPASMVTGDLVILFAQSRTTPDTLTISATGGQTWTTETGQVAGSSVVRLFWCRYNGTWDADPSVTGFTTSGSRSTSVIMHVFRPTSSANTWELDVAQTIGAFTGPATPFDYTMAEITTLTNGAVVFTALGISSARTFVLQTAGWANAGDAQDRNLSGSDITASAAYLVKTTAGATGSVTNRGSAGDNWVGLILAWKEISAATPDTAFHHTILRSRMKEF